MSTRSIPEVRRVVADIDLASRAVLGNGVKPPQGLRSVRKISPFDQFATAPTDEALMLGMSSGDQKATVAFVRRYQRRVFGLAVGILGDPTAAEDVAQEALLRAWRHAPVFDSRRGSVENWVLTIARNLSIDALRKRRSIPTDPDELVSLASVSLGMSTEEAVASRAMGAIMVVALQRLPEEQRRAVVLSSLLGQTAQEIAESEHIPLGTAKTRIRGGLLRLRALLNEQEEHRS